LGYAVTSVEAVEERGSDGNHAGLSDFGLLTEGMVRTVTQDRLERIQLVLTT
jgi:hypothetical protein